MTKTELQDNLVFLSALKLLEQLTLDDMYKLLGADGWGSAAVDNIGKGQTYEMDGPAALSYVFDAFMALFKLN